MFKSLLRTLPSLSGNFKFACEINDIDKEDTSIFYTHIRSCTLQPLQNNVFNRKINVNLTTGLLEYDVAKFYKKYYDIFYSENYQYILDDYTDIDVNNNDTKEMSRNKNYEFGCKHISYDNTGYGFEFYAPIYITSVDDLPDYFEININFNNADIKKIKIYINDNSSNNYLGSYLKRYLYKVNENFIYISNNLDYCLYSGISVENGGLVNIEDNNLCFYINNMTTVNKFDHELCKGFERHRLISKQIIPLSFHFNIFDILTDFEKKYYTMNKVQITGSYVKNNDHCEFYDFDINYKNKYIKDLVFDIKSSLYYKTTYRKNNNTLFNIVDNNNILSLNESKFMKYQFENKLSPIYCAWKLMLSDDNIPYITNANNVFTNMYNFSYGFFPKIHINKIEKNKYVEIKDNALLTYSNMGSKKSDYDSYYNKIKNTYFSTWFNIVDKYNGTDDDPIENIYDKLFNDDDKWSSIKNGYAYYNGILYNFNKVKEIKDVNYFGVFVMPNVMFGKTEATDNTSSIIFSNNLSKNNTINVDTSSLFKSSIYGENKKIFDFSGIPNYSINEISKINEIKTTTYDSLLKSNVFYQIKNSDVFNIFVKLNDIRKYISEYVDYDLETVTFSDNTELTIKNDIIQSVEKTDMYNSSNINVNIGYDHNIFNPNINLIRDSYYNAYLVDEYVSLYDMQEYINDIIEKLETKNENGDYENTFNENLSHDQEISLLNRIQNKLLKLNQYQLIFDPTLNLVVTYDEYWPNFVNMNYNVTNVIKENFIQSAYVQLNKIFDNNTFNDVKHNIYIDSKNIENSVKAISNNKTILNELSKISNNNTIQYVKIDNFEQLLFNIKNRYPITFGFNTFDGERTIYNKNINFFDISEFAKEQATTTVISPITNSPVTVMPFYTEQTYEKIACIYIYVDETKHENVYILSGYKEFICGFNTYIQNEDVEIIHKDDSTIFDSSHYNVDFVHYINANIDEKVSDFIEKVNLAKDNYVPVQQGHGNYVIVNRDVKKIINNFIKDFNTFEVVELNTFDKVYDESISMLSKYVLAIKDTNGNIYPIDFYAKKTLIPLNDVLMTYIKEHKFEYYMFVNEDQTNKHNDSIYVSNESDIINEYTNIYKSIGLVDNTNIEKCTTQKFYLPLENTHNSSYYNIDDYYNFDTYIQNKLVTKNSDKTYSYNIRKQSYLYLLYDKDKKDIKNIIELLSVIIYKDIDRFIKIRRPKSFLETEILVLCQLFDIFSKNINKNSFIQYFKNIFKYIDSNEELFKIANNVKTNLNNINDMFLNSNSDINTSTKEFKRLIFENIIISNNIRNNLIESYNDLIESIIKNETVLGNSLRIIDVFNSNSIYMMIILYITKCANLLYDTDDEQYDEIVNELIRINKVDKAYFDSLDAQQLIYNLVEFIFTIEDNYKNINVEKLHNLYSNIINYSISNNDISLYTDISILDISYNTINNYESDNCNVTTISTQYDSNLKISTVTYKDGTSKKYAYYILNVNVNNFGSYDLPVTFTEFFNKINSLELDNTNLVKSKFVQKYFNELIPLYKLDIVYFFIKQSKTIQVPSCVSQNIMYKSVIDRNNKIKDINLTTNKITTQFASNITRIKNNSIKIYRYFNYIMPVFIKTNIIYNQYDKIYKDSNIIFDKFNLVNEDVNIYKYNGLTLIDSYTYVDSLNVNFDKVIPFEYKHYNDNVLYLLSNEFSYTYPNKLTYDELLTMENEENTYKIFKFYIKNMFNKSLTNENEILFLFNKYKASYISQNVKLTFGAKEKLYTLKFVFKLI